LPPDATGVDRGSGEKMSTITTIEELEAIYGLPLEASIVKEVDLITPHYRALIEASPFAVLATSGPEGLDCSPRGDRPGFVRIVDAKTLMLPDRRGNSRVDSLRNIVRDPRVALLFMIPGSGTTLRINGLAHLSIAAEVLASFMMDGKAPRSVIVIEVAAIYFQCARAIVRSELWNPERHVDPNTLPSAGQILAALSDNRVGGEEYGREWPARAKKSLW
jgi:PPOX class probable FMN-dependent enzyme